MFEGTSFKLDYLTKPSGLEDFGFSKKVKMADRAQASDKIFLVAYPYFNVNGMFLLLRRFTHLVLSSSHSFLLMGLCCAGM